MKRRCWQHKSECHEVGCYCSGERLKAIRAQEHDRTFDAHQGRFFCHVNCAVAADNTKIAGHQRKRFCVALLQFAQFCHRLGLGGIASQLITAKPLNGDDLAFLYETEASIDVVQHRMLFETERFSVKADQTRRGAAGVAGGCFGVEAAVGWIGIFARARLAQFKAAHRCR